MKKTWRIACLAAALLLTVTGCGGGETSSDPVATTDAGVSTQTTTSVVDSTTTVSLTEGEATTTTAPTASGSQTTTGKTTQGSETKVPTTTTAPQEPVEMNYKAYNLATWMTPIWEGDTVYNETLMFVPDPVTKEIKAAPLMYEPDKILSVRSFDLTKEYKEGVDYTVENGCIKLTDRTRIPTWKYDDYFCRSAIGFDLPSISAPGRHLKYGAGATFQKTQVCVTYTHKDKWQGPEPAYMGGTLSRTAQRLKDKQSLSIVYNGDSICVGAEASKWNNIAPWTPIWADMVTDQLKATYGGNIVANNTAVGGMDAKWGLENVENNINKYNPDLVLLHFGMNDGTQGVTPDDYRTRMEGIIKAVRAKNPNCEFILVSTTLPNPDVNGWTKYQKDYQPELEKLAAAYKGVAVVKMTDMHEYLLTCKRYWDMTGNNINHPNDFLNRVYAQVVAKALVDNL